jgi:glycosyltransferase involved in cell wall biosynthesis
VKTVWIWNHYATNTFFDRGGRHYWFAKYLARDGYSPVVFCASTVHNKAESVDVGRNVYKEDSVDGIPFLFVKTPQYKGNGLSRIKNMLFFARNVMRAAKIRGEKEKPDAIIASSVHPFTCVAGILAAKKMKAPCVVEIRDLWPESIVAYSVASKKNPLVQAMYMLEKWIYKKADKLVFTHEGCKDYILEKGWGKSVDMGKIRHINNGVDLELFDANVKEFHFADGDLADESIFKAVYVGSIRRVNNLAKLVDAAEELARGGHGGIKVLLWGDGDELEAVKNDISKKGLDNIVCKGRVDKKYIPSIVSQADVNIMHWEKSGIMRFGMSANKIFEYLASGKPVLNDVSSRYDVIKRHNAGITIDSQEPGAIAEALSAMKDWPEGKRKAVGQNARLAACDYDFKNLTKCLENVLE